jgi:hypothetical protein
MAAFVVASFTYRGKLLKCFYLLTFAISNVTKEDNKILNNNHRSDLCEVSEFVDRCEDFSSAVVWLDKYL